MQLLWNHILWDCGVGYCGYFYSLTRQQSLYLRFFQTEEDYIPYPSVHEVGLYWFYNLVSAAFWKQLHWILFECVTSWLCGIFWQVLGRKSPFPLILLPQFGGYWIEGTNHELNDTEQLPPLSPDTRTKLECNTTATLFRKHFLGKVSHSLLLKLDLILCMFWNWISLHVQNHIWFNNFKPGIHMHISVR